jgi:hypothetical protein
VESTEELLMKELLSKELFMWGQPPSAVRRAQLDSSSPELAIAASGQFRRVDYLRSVSENT